MMNKEELNEVILKHGLWLSGDPTGVKADLSRADLSGSCLSRANLSEADLSGADLSWADLSGADLSEANLSGANLIGANLRGADLSEADLSGADLSWADLREADLSWADLRGSCLSRANLRGATHVETAIVDNHTLFFSMQCPESGSYTGFKKAGGRIVQLEIPADALRSSATSRKCRASKAFVVSITDMDGNPAGDRVESDYDKSFVYTVGEFIEVKDFDTDRWNECAPGIHHYITRAEACATYRIERSTQ